MYIVDFSAFNIISIYKNCRGSLYIIYIYIYTYTCACIYVKPPDEYHWQGRNSFNYGIFVILKKL
jgi:hypothetical protein